MESHEPASTVGARLGDRAAAIEARGGDRNIVTRFIIYLSREKREGTGIATVMESGVDIVQRGPRDIGTGGEPRS